MRKITTIIVLILLNFNLFGQDTPFNIAIEAISIPELGGLHSYSFGQNNGKWLILGGRLDGLHQRQPRSSFDILGHNKQLIVIDPVAQKKWTASIASLPAKIQEQVSSTNMQFYQENDYLYVFGGYGYSNTVGDHTTYANLTAITVSKVIDAVINQTDFTSYFRQIEDSEFQVTGGRVKKIKNKFYLLGGQKFIGRYNPQGPNNGPGFVQEYTDAVRIFTIEDNGTTITINHLTPLSDTNNLHRRDYNAESQIMPNGEEGITMFSGVFQKTVDLPFLNSVDISDNSYVVNNNFQQYYNHYHCGVIPLYSASNNEMHTVFFGGIAQYYDNNGTLVQDDKVPFVKTIARVTRDSNGKMAEYKLPVEMPALLGAGAEFIVNETITHYKNEVLKLDEITQDSTLLGYIYGGINSSAINIFTTNTGSQSTADNQIFKIYLLLDSSNTDDGNDDSPVGLHDLNEQSIGSLKMIVYPNPNHGDFIIKYNLIKNDDVMIKITDLTGRILDSRILKNQQLGENVYKKRIKGLQSGGIYFVSIETSYEKARRKVILKP